MLFLQQTILSLRCNVRENSHFIANSALHITATATSKLWIENGHFIWPKRDKSRTTNGRRWNNRFIFLSSFKLFPPSFSILLSYIQNSTWFQIGTTLSRKAALFLCIYKYTFLSSIEQARKWAIIISTRKHTTFVLNYSPIYSWAGQIILFWSCWAVAFKRPVPLRDKKFYF